jgi:hypothetical protein
MRMQDIRTTLRFMRTRPLFAIGTVSMLALGLGATTAILSVIYSVLLRPLPFPDPDRLVRVWDPTRRAMSRMATGVRLDVHGEQVVSEYGRYPQPASRSRVRTRPRASPAG